MSTETYVSPRGLNIEIDRSRDNLLTEFGKETLSDRYLFKGESYQDLFARVATYCADDVDHAQRLYDYISKQWFMPSTPVLSNLGTDRGLPISCFLNDVDDSMDGIISTWEENSWLSNKGGGIGTYYGNVRSIGEPVGKVGKTSGVIPFIKVQDSLTLAISQGSLRRGSAAVYLQIDHPEIEEFIEVRKPTGGDHNRRSLNVHHGILISDAFMNCVENNLKWQLRSPKDGHIVKKVNARELWIKILTTRLETGEPYMIYIDTVNKSIPEWHRLAGLNVKTSNLCSEITLPTGKDKYGNRRTAVCCLSSLNLETYEQWKSNKEFISDVMRFLDNILTEFVRKAPKEFKNAVYCAAQERSVGLGVMGFHGFLQSKNIPFESAMAKVWNKKIFKSIENKCNLASEELAEEKGPCKDAEDFAYNERFSNKTAIAPTASISIICGGASPGIEPIAANSFNHKTLSGNYNVKNKYLVQLLETKAKNTPEVWSSITTNGGSVQHLKFLSKDEKDTFKTAFELDQRWIIEHAADRTPFIDQAQSVNIFIPANISKKELHKLHFSAWEKGVKSLYYCRSKSIQRAEVVNNQTKNDNDGEECLACQ